MSILRRPTFRPRSALARFGVPALAVLAAALVWLTLGGQVEPSPIPLFLAAVVIGAWFGGLLSGVTATLLSTAVYLYLYLLDLAPMPDASGSRPGFWLVVFILIALVMTDLIAALQRAQQDAERAQQDMEYLALHDMLTGLPNRTLLDDRLRQTYLSARRDGSSYTLFFIDLDGFKEVNDTLGHQYGDVLLTLVADRLETVLRASDTVARMGGDEFAILLPGSDLSGGEQVAGKILESLTEPFDLDGHSVLVGASIGIAVSLAGGETVTTLMQRADKAMYHAKRTRCGYEVAPMPVDQPA